MNGKCQLRNSNGEIIYLQVLSSTFIITSWIFSLYIHTKNNELLGSVPVISSVMLHLGNYCFVGVTRCNDSNVGRNCLMHKELP